MCTVNNFTKIGWRDRFKSIFYSVLYKFSFRYCNWCSYHILSLLYIPYLCKWLFCNNKPLFCELQVNKVSLLICAPPHPVSYVWATQLVKQLTFSMMGQCSALLFDGPTWVSRRTMGVTVHDGLFVGPFPRAACLYLF